MMAQAHKNKEQLKWEYVILIIFAHINVTKANHLQLFLERRNSKQNRAWLFKTNDVVSLHFVKISNVKISNTPIFFVEKM